MGLLLRAEGIGQWFSTCGSPPKDWVAKIFPPPMGQVPRGGLLVALLWGGGRGLWVGQKVGRGMPRWVTRWVSLPEKAREPLALSLPL